MGQQHNTHVANNTDDTIKAVLTTAEGASGLNTSEIIPPGQYVCIPTPHVRGTLSVFRKVPDSNPVQFYPQAEAQRTDDSDRSFIVKKVQGALTVVRTKQGSIWQEETGLRK
ncbi:hypothetical protein GJAV_G00088630 [Gymnothorax javanicus]|nr:hypothetical protein GJAV_G00088630 [Gymnothorax javanicus]